MRGVGHSSYYSCPVEPYTTCPTALPIARLLQYMLLCKVLQGSASEVGAIMAGKWGIKHTGVELDAMSEVAKSAKNR